MKKRPVIYPNYWQYVRRRILGPLLLVMAAFVFAFIYFTVNRAAEMASIRATKMAQDVGGFRSIDRAPK